MATPKKPVKKKPAAKITGAKKHDPAPDQQAKKKIIDDDDDEDDYDLPLEEMGGYDSLEGYDDDDDY